MTKAGGGSPEESASSDVSGADERLDGDLAQLRSDVAKLTESVSQLLRNQAEAGADRIGAGLDAAKGALGETAGSFARAGRGLAEDAQHRLGALGDDLERSIHRSPLTAVLAAAALGMALGLMHRSR